jgi:hypothetical protein
MRKHNHPRGSGGSRSDSGSSSINSRADDRVFTMFAFVNMIGEKQTDSGPIHPVRAAVCKALSEAPPRNVRRLRFLYEGVASRVDTYWFAAAALSLSAAPEFEFNTPRRGSVEGSFLSGLESFVNGTVGLANHLTEFYRAARVRELWRRVKPEYERTGSRMRAQASQVLSAYEAILGQAISRSTGEITIIPNLLEPNRRSFGVPIPSGLSDLHCPVKGDRYLPTEVLRPIVAKALAPSAHDQHIARLVRKSENPRKVLEDALLGALVAAVEGRDSTGPDGNTRLHAALTEALRASKSSEPLGGRIGRILSHAGKVLERSHRSEPAHQSAKHGDGGAAGGPQRLRGKRRRRRPKAQSDRQR